ncbi:MAG: hypothetical protein AB1772_08200 [Candidatus Zixiibacteriota bacterium]
MWSPLGSGTDGEVDALLAFDNALIVGGQFAIAGGKATPHIARWTKHDLCCSGRVGDANGIGGDEPTIGDVTIMIDAKFISLTCDGFIACLAEADVNQSGGGNPTCGDVSIGDITLLIDYLFITGQSLGLPDCQ